MGIEAGRDDDELRLECGYRRLDDLGERLQVLAIPGACGERDVDDSFRVRPGPARPRPERPLMQRDGEHRRVVGEQRLGAVSVMHVEVDDGDPLEPERELRVPGGDGHVREDAEPHRLGSQGMVAGRAHECESAHLDSLDRAAGCEPRRVAGGHARVGVRVEPDGPRDPFDRVHVLGGVHRLDLRPGCRRTGDEVGEPLVQNGRAGRDLVGPRPDGRVQVDERRMADHVHSSASSSRRATCGRPRSRTCSAAPAQSGSTSGSGGSGAVRSIVAMRR